MQHGNIPKHVHRSGTTTIRLWQKVHSRVQWLSTDVESQQTVSVSSATTFTQM